MRPTMLEHLDLLNMPANANALLAFAVAGTSTVALSLAGKLPRVGPLRALSLGLRSRLLANKGPFSARVEKTNEIKTALQMTKQLSKQSHLIVTGGEGVGKTCLIKTATNKTFGVLHVKVSLLCDLLKTWAVLMVLLA
eukprot:Colp12_sorted_trinity150504_noHs@1104